MALRACRQSWALALVLALAMPAAPVLRMATAGCERCPRSCPMHAKVAKKQPGCHHGTQAPAPPRDCHRTPGFTLPGCGYAGDPPLASLAPAVLPTRALTWVVVATPAPRAHVLPLGTRAADPPDTPPPIVSA